MSCFALVWPNYELQSSQIRRGLPSLPGGGAATGLKGFLFIFFQRGAEEPLSIWNHAEFLHLRYLT